MKKDEILNVVTTVVNQFIDRQDVKNNSYRQSTLIELKFNNGTFSVVAKNNKSIDILKHIPVTPIVAEEDWQKVLDENLLMKIQHRYILKTMYVSKTKTITVKDLKEKLSKINPSDAKNYTPIEWMRQLSSFLYRNTNYFIRSTEPWMRTGNDNKTYCLTSKNCNLPTY